MSAWNFIKSVFKKKEKLVTDARFEKSLDFVLKHEGGLVNDPADSGGLTNLGISKRAHPELTDKEIVNMTRERAAKIYHKDYWLPSSALAFDWPACLAIFDMAVNCGVKKSTEIADKALASWSGAEPIDVKILALKICAGRIRFYRRLAEKEPSMQKFLKGWTNRVDALRKLAEENSGGLGSTVI